MRKADYVSRVAFVSDGEVSTHAGRSVTNFPAG
jgi:hypothetical protein